MAGANSTPQEEFHRGGFGRVWAWAKGHHARWVSAHNWAARRAKIARDPKSRQAFLHAKGVYGRHARATRPPKPGDGWPAHMHIVELFNNDNGFHNHLHVAVAADSRDELIQVEKIAIDNFGAAGCCREFPPFDPVECVHVGNSMHYQDHRDWPGFIRSCANRGDGLACDNSFSDRQAFGNELKARYGADRCDF
jgi:hypothetical protein